jgi:hypothetical protein
VRAGVLAALSAACVCAYGQETAAAGASAAAVVPGAPSSSDTEVQSSLPEAPAARAAGFPLQAEAALAVPDLPAWLQTSGSSSSSSQQDSPGNPAQVRGADGKIIRPQTGRIFGIFPNFVSISGGRKPKPAGWKTDFVIANKQNYDYSSFGFLLISSALAYGQNSHPAFNTYHGGDAVFWAYLWRGFLDKTDATYQGSFFFPALLHEDTRYYAQGTGPWQKRMEHALLSVVVAHDYNQKPIFNLAGQLGRVGTQAVSTTYYPAGSEDFGVLAEKFAYSNLRSMIYAVVREFSPEAQDFVARRHERKVAKEAAKDQ